MSQIGIGLARFSSLSELASFPSGRPLATLPLLQRTTTNHYATLGLDQRCTTDQIREAYRVLAKALHPDLNPGSDDAVKRTQDLNAAYEILSDPERRRAYDDSVAAEAKQRTCSRAGKLERDVSQDVHLRIEELLRGTSLEIRVNDPGNREGQEVYALDIPPDTAPGTRFRIRREGAFSGGRVQVRVRARPDFRFKIRGSDLRCDLRISARRATQGGPESVRGATGDYLRVQVPPGVARGDVLRVPGEGLPKARGGRGDLLVRIVYAPQVRITRVK